MVTPNSRGFASTGWRDARMCQEKKELTMESENREKYMSLKTMDFIHCWMVALAKRGEH
jgi:hypothetical protein